MARKITEQQVRDKEATKKKLLDAVGEILRTEGYAKLGVNYVAHKADMSKKLIYRYFGSLENLVSSYVLDVDYWTPFIYDRYQIADSENLNLPELLAGSLKELTDHLAEHQEVREIIRWELSSRNKVMNDVHSKRELLGSKLFASLDHNFKNSELDIRTIYGLLLGGVYYISLHSKVMGNKFCDVDVGKEDGLKRIKKSIDDIIGLVLDQISAGPEKK